MLTLHVLAPSQWSHTSKHTRSTDTRAHLSAQSLSDSPFGLYLPLFSPSFSLPPSYRISLWLKPPLRGYSLPHSFTHSWWSIICLHGISLACACVCLRERGRVFEFAIMQQLFNPPVDFPWQRALLCYHWCVCVCFKFLLTVNGPQGGKLAA